MYTNDVKFEKYSFLKKTLYKDSSYMNRASDYFYDSVQRLDKIRSYYNKSSTTYKRSIWNKNLLDKTFLIIDTEYKHKVFNEKYSLMSAVYFDISTGSFNIYKSFFKILDYSSKANETIYDEHSIKEFEYFKDLIINVDYLVMHQSAADTPRISKIFNISKDYLYNKTIDTYYSTRMLFKNFSHGKNFYSLANIYSNLLCYGVWISSCDKYITFGGPMRHLVELKTLKLEYIINSKKFQEHHSTFDATLTFIIFLEYLTLYIDYPEGVVHHIDR